MDLSFLNEYLVLVVLGICLCAGYVIKTLSTINNRYIPLIMAVLGVSLNIWINMDFTADILLSGLFSGLASTGLHQLFSRLIIKDAQER